MQFVVNTDIRHHFALLSKSTDNKKPKKIYKNAFQWNAYIDHGPMFLFLLLKAGRVLGWGGGGSGTLWRSGPREGDPLSCLVVQAGMRSVGCYP